jgi:hypothetical protein
MKRAPARDPPGPGNVLDFPVAAVAGSPALSLTQVLHLYDTASRSPSVIFLSYDDIELLPFAMILPGTPSELLPGKASFHPTAVRP